MRCVEIAEIPCVTNISSKIDGRLYWQMPYLREFQKADKVATLQPKEGTLKYITDLLPFTVSTIMGKLLNDLGSSLIRSTGKFSVKCILRNFTDNSSFPANFRNQGHHSESQQRISTKFFQ